MRTVEIQGEKVTFHRCLFNMHLFIISYKIYLYKVIYIKG